MTEALEALLQILTTIGAFLLAVYLALCIMAVGLCVWLVWVAWTSNWANDAEADEELESRKNPWSEK